MTRDEFYTEYDRLAAWRDLWNRLSHRKPKTERGKLQTRDEAVQRRAQIADNGIRALMNRWDTEGPETEPTHAATISDSTSGHGEAA